MKAWAASIHLPEDERARLFGLALAFPKTGQPDLFDSAANDIAHVNGAEGNEMIELF